MIERKKRWRLAGDFEYKEIDAGDVFNESEDKPDAEGDG